MALHDKEIKELHILKVVANILGTTPGFSSTIVKSSSSATPTFGK